MTFPKPIRGFSTAARVHPPPPNFGINPQRQKSFNQFKPPKVGRAERWYLPATLVIALGFALYNRYESEEAFIAAHSPTELEIQREAHMRLLEAYGNRMSLSDVEKALEVYEVQ